MTPGRFRALVLAHYNKHGRTHLPWRKTKDPYKILVSELMLQQTQVARVIPYYNAFLKRFPSVDALAAAPLKEVLALWSGLGYNRRAKYLHEAAKAVMANHSGVFPQSVDALTKLPGVGRYTARAVMAFAHNADVYFIETNIRTAVIQSVFPERTSVTDAQILAVLEKAHPKGHAREWYSALMDYGAHLKQSGVRSNTKSASYTKQAAFKGSTREARGAILRALKEGPKTATVLLNVLGEVRREQMRDALAALTTEGLVSRRGNRYSLPA